MNDYEQLEQIRRKIESANGDGAPISRHEALSLLRALDEQSKRSAELEKKNGVLSRHVMELTEELENVKADFGGGDR
ncbi:MAG: hypothetical protein JO102_02185 [Elusimicrobia bacterium]|nr:hypothetical protein [Elusimicrobiota bacterium]